MNWRAGTKRGCGAGCASTSPSRNRRGIEQTFDGGASQFWRCCCAEFSNRIAELAWQNLSSNCYNPYIHFSL
jgi:hypothetical protein